MIKQRKLPEHLQFNIEIGQGVTGLYCQFKDVNNNDLPPYKEKLTPSQWRKAEKYLNRKLVPFAGYIYTPKIGTVIGIYKIR